MRLKPVVTVGISAAAWSFTQLNKVRAYIRFIRIFGYISWVQSRKVNEAFAQTANANRKENLRRCCPWMQTYTFARWTRSDWVSPVASTCGMTYYWIFNRLTIVFNRFLCANFFRICASRDGNYTPGLHSRTTAFWHYFAR